MSLSELGKRAGIDRTAIARAERRGYDPRASTVSAIAKGLGVPVCELFEETGHERSNDRPVREGGKRRERGIFQRHAKGCARPENGSCGCAWWVCYFDENGQKHREKVGPKGLASKVYQKRKTEVRECRFFPESIGRRPDLLLKDVDRRLP